MEKLTILLSMILLGSCVSIPPGPLYDIRIDGANTRCRVRCYDYNKLETVSDNKCNDEDTIFRSGNYPIEECDQVLGPSIQFFAEELRPGVRFNQRQCED